MKLRALKPLLFPAILLAVGLALGAAAETAVARWQDYGLYGLLRPAADLVLLIAGIWLVVAGAGIARAIIRRRRARRQAARDA